jgi:hypothetical protein
LLLLPRILSWILIYESKDKEKIYILLLYKKIESKCYAQSCGVPLCYVAGVEEKLLRN